MSSMIHGEGNIHPKRPAQKDLSQILGPAFKEEVRQELIKEMHADFDRRSLALHVALANLNQVSAKTVITYAADIEEYLSNGKSNLRSTSNA